MSNRRAEYRRTQRRSTVHHGTEVDDGGIELLPFESDPGCDSPMHRQFIESRMMGVLDAYFRLGIARGAWLPVVRGPVRMDCGCTMRPVPTDRLREAGYCAAALDANERLEP